jgi:membrane-associated phospholipid phosphatase
MLLQAGPLGNLFGRVIWEVVSFSADGVVWFLILPAIHLFAPHHHFRLPSPHAVRLAAVGLATDILIIVALKQTFRRQRPTYHRPDFRFVGPDQFSFPSGHATRAWLLTGLAAAHLAVGDGNSGPHRLAAIATWAAIVSLGRVALGESFLCFWCLRTTIPELRA